MSVPGACVRGTSAGSGKREGRISSIVRSLLGALLLAAAGTAAIAEDAAPPPASATQGAPSEPAPPPAEPAPGSVAQTPAPAPEPIKPDDILQAVLGIQVVAHNGDTVGRLVDILVDKAGIPRKAVLDAGGFMGVGSRRVAVPWRDLHFEPGSKEPTIAISMSAEEIKAAPEYKGPPHPPQPAAPAAPAAAQAPPPAPAAVPAAVPPPPAPPGPAGAVSDPDGPAPASVRPAPEPKPPGSGR